MLTIVNTAVIQTFEVISGKFNKVWN